MKVNAANYLLAGAGARQGSCRVHHAADLFIGRRLHSQDLLVFHRVPLRRAEVAYTAVAMIDVVPIHKLAPPLPRILQRLEPLGGELGPVFGGTEQAFLKGVVVTHPRPRVRGFHTQPVQHGQHRGGPRWVEPLSLCSTPMAAVYGGNALGPGRCASPDARRARHCLRVHFPANDLAAVKVHDQVQVEPLAHHVAGQVGHVPHQTCAWTLTHGFAVHAWPAAIWCGHVGDSAYLHTGCGRTSTRWPPSVRLCALRPSAHGSPWGGAPGRRSLLSSTSLTFQRCSVHASIHTSLQAWLRRVPLRYATSIICAMWRQSSSQIIRPHPCGRSPRAFLRAPVAQLSRPGPCPCGARRYGWTRPWPLW